MEIVENLEQWKNDYERGWLAHRQANGQFNWDLYPKVKNRTAPTGPGIDLAKSRLALISSAGGYLPDSQEPFDAQHPLGDYSIRLFPAGTPFLALAYTHEHYDHTAVNEDPQVLLPLLLLKEKVAQGEVGELAPSVISFMGYQPDVGRVVNETVPAIVEAAQAEAVDAALIVPA